MKKHTTSIRVAQDTYQEATKRQKELNFGTFSALVEALLLSFLSEKSIIVTAYVSGKPIYQILPEAEGPDQDAGKLLSNASMDDLLKKVQEVQEKKREEGSK